MRHLGRDCIFVFFFDFVFFLFLQEGQDGSPVAGHSRDVLSIALSYDGRTLASAGRDASVLLWDTRTHKVVKALGGHRASVRALTSRRDAAGAELYSGSLDRCARVWSLEQRAFIETLFGHQVRLGRSHTTATRTHDLLSLEPGYHFRGYECSRWYISGRLGLWHMGKHGLSERDALIGDAPSSLSIFSPHALPTHVKHCCIFPASISRQSHPGVLLPVSDSVPPPSLQEGITALDAVGEDTLLSASDDRTLRLWKVADETQLLFSGGEASLMLSLEPISPICQSPFFPYLTLKFSLFRRA